jgi:acetyl-CoA C-acetyltransferase
MPATTAFVFDAIRTPRGKGKPTGSLFGSKPLDLVVGLIHAMLARNDRLDRRRVDDIALGCVSPVGDQGADIAKTAAIKAGLPDTVGGVQLNRFCASGLEAVNVAAQKVASGWEDLVFAGGVESMSRVPIGSDCGAWMNDPETSHATSYVPQGVGADLIATLEEFSRADVDAYAVRSQERASTAWCEGRFGRSIVPVTDRNDAVILDHDELIRSDTTVEALTNVSCWAPALRPIACAEVTAGFAAGATRSKPESFAGGGGQACRPDPRRLANEVRSLAREWRVSTWH